MYKIVIIDDDRQVLQGMKRVIPWEELEAEWAGEAMDGEQGLELIRETQPDIVLTDIYMPVMNGLDMIEKLRHEQFEGKIIILSGYSDFEYARHALRLNVQDYLSKPVTVQTIKEVLQSVISTVEQENMKRFELGELEKKLMLYEPFVVKEWMKSVATGVGDLSFENMPQITNYKFKWENNKHVVIGLQMIEKAAERDVKLNDSNGRRFSIQRMIHELIKEESLECEVIELHSHQMILWIHVDPSAIHEETTSRFRMFGKKIIQQMEAEFNLTVYVGIGTVKNHWQEIADSTEEAFYSLSTQGSVELSGFNLFEFKNRGEDIDRLKNQNQLIRPIQFYQQLVEAIRHSQKKVAYEKIQEYMDRMQLHGGISPSLLHRLGTEIWGILSYSLYDVGIFLDEIFPEIDLKKEMTVIQTQDDFKKWLMNKIEEICGNRQWNENLKHKQAVDFMIQYIHEHFSENITLNDLANQVYISRNYLSQIFKKATGISFNQYLTQVRMEKAKAMILEGQYLIYEIAEKVGFKNVPYFSTLFKKHTGLNPTDLVK
ncbi:response regulator transcription factor [Neobacillus pocheonensis]|uniref:response regulator transcription factor n=1 Tax=Neobacillus pocheonensis TaxID=363869 RepID=UPI003D2CE8B8